MKWNFLRNEVSVSFIDGQKFQDFMEKNENLLNSPSRGNLVDGLPRAASFVTGIEKLMKSNISFFLGPI